MGVWKRNPILGHVIYRLTQVKEPFTLDLEDAIVDVENAVRLEKARSLALESAKKSLIEVENGETIERLAAKLGLKTKTLTFRANTRFLPDVGDNKEFRKVSLKLNQNRPFGLSLNDNRADLIHFKQRTLDLENAEDQKNKVRSQLRQNLQQALLKKELKRLREAAKIEIINSVFQTPDA